MSTGTHCHSTAADRSSASGGWLCHTHTWRWHQTCWLSKGTVQVRTCTGTSRPTDPLRWTWWSVASQLSHCPRSGEIDTCQSPQHGKHIPPTINKIRLNLTPIISNSGYWGVPPETHGDGGGGWWSVGISWEPSRSSTCPSQHLPSRRSKKLLPPGKPVTNSALSIRTQEVTVPYGASSARGTWTCCRTCCQSAAPCLQV